MSSSSRRRTSDVEGREGKDKKGLLTRWKSILKKTRDPSSSSSASSTSSSPKRQSVMFETQPPEVDDEAVDISHELPLETLPATLSRYEGATRIPRAQIHEERARRLRDNFGVEIEPSEWHSSEGDVYRVEKPVRITVRRDCHKCQSAFGANNKCPSCSHQYCITCGRSPPRRTDSQKKASQANREANCQKQDEFAPIIPHYGIAEPIVVTRRNKTGGQPLEYRPVRMRVRRKCHRCNTTFTSSTRVCQTCGHRQCDDCPKNKKDKKYPYGHPDDAPGENSPKFHECHECHEVYPPNSANGTECRNCSHQKCSDCRRARRRRVEPEVDPGVLRSISSRFEQLELS